MPNSKHRNNDKKLATSILTYLGVFLFVVFIMSVKHKKLKQIYSPAFSQPTYIDSDLVDQYKGIDLMDQGTLNKLVLQSAYDVEDFYKRLQANNTEL